MALLTTTTAKLELSRAKEILEKTNQPKILEFLTKCEDPEKIDRVLIQLATFEREYPGGLENYVAKITKLLKEYVENVTKYDGCELKAPATFHLSWDDDLNVVRETDLKGAPHLKKCAFFLLAGGLGERMGFDGAKPCMAIDSITQLTYLELYCNYLKEYQELFAPEEVTLPLVVMTIPETQRSIRKQLEEHHYFGLKPDQFYFLNQYQVPAVLNMNGEIDFDAETATIHCKPHGHGECHLLMHKSGLARKFKEQGFEWITFFNDTNPLSFRFLPSYLGIASQHDWETTYVCVKRKPGEAVGAVCEVDLPDRTIITNVEYNILEKLGKSKPEPIDAEGYSKLPGNVNFIIISLKTYSEALEKSSGFVPEFINPKFQADGHTLKSPTRMETLISEYTYLLPDSKRVGAIQCDRLMCFTSAKNEIELGLQRQAKSLSTETCGACQFEFYQHNRILLQKVGVEVEETYESQTMSGLRYDVGPRIVLRPTFAATFSDLEKSIQSKVKISSRTFIDLNRKAVLDNVSFDGSYRLDNAAKTPVELATQEFHNKHYVTFKDLDGLTQEVTYDDKMRGFLTFNKDKIENIN